MSVINHTPEHTPSSQYKIQQKRDNDVIASASNVSTDLLDTHITTHGNTREVIADDISADSATKMKRDKMRGGEDPINKLESE